MSSSSSSSSSTEIRSSSSFSSFSSSSSSSSFDEIYGSDFTAHTNANSQWIISGTYNGQNKYTNVDTTLVLLYDNATYFGGNIWILTNSANYYSVYYYRNNPSVTGVYISLNTGQPEGNLHYGLDVSSSSLSSSSLSSSSSSFSSSSSSSYINNWSSSSSSSSSSSYLDFKDDKSIPFIFEVNSVYPIWTMVAYGEDVYGGTGNGLLLKSTDRYFWGREYIVNDVNVKSLYIQNDTLFIGTSPNGLIYIRDLISGQTSLSQQISGEVFGFAYFQNNMYAFGGIPNQVYLYNIVKNRWDVVYKVPASITNKILIFNSKLYIFTNSENIISFNGTNWQLETYGAQNVASLRNVTTEPYSNSSNSFIDRSNVQTAILSGIFTNEEIYDIYPQHYSMGLKSADVDGSSLVVGTIDYAKVYNFVNSSTPTFYPIFQTEGNTVNYLLNIDVGVNLASIGNKLYLVYCGDLPSNTTTTTTPHAISSTTTTTTSLVGIIYPKGGEAILVGTTITIQWTSTTSTNDSVSIDLYKGDTLELTINPNTSNDGTYDWDVPNSLLPALDYKIVITWLSVGKTSGNKTESGNFGIFYSALPTTTTTTTTPIDTTMPQVQSSRGIPLLDLDDEYITYMIKDNAKGGILFATSNGRVLGCSNAVVNAYLTGERKVYAEVTDGFGNISDTASSTFLYSLYNKIVEINEDKEIIKWQFQKESTAILTDRLTGTFLSPILSVKEDLDFWKQLIWQESKPTNTEIIICIRAADSIEQLESLPWDYCFVSNDSDRGYGTSGFIIRELNTYQIKGKYLQFKVTMTTDTQNVTPSILNLSITYSTKFATYFYTTKFSLQNQSGVKSGLLTANITQPQNTEIRFGIAGTNSSNWNDYEVVGLNKMFSLNDLERMKVGIKMIAYDTEVPEVAEFSLLTGSDKINKINEI